MGNMRKQFIPRRWTSIFSQEIERLIGLINNNLRENLNIKCAYQKAVLDAMSYSLFPGGKRLRPIFALKSFELFHDDLDLILPYASAIEMIHTYSLIHDDLPAMDDDDIRRGKASSHKEFGEAMAILAGDGLLNLAYEIIFDDLGQEKNPETLKRKIRAGKVIGQAAGVCGMIGGQVVDISSDNRVMDDDRLLFMYKAKTGALFRAAIMSGAIVAGASQEEEKILEDYAYYLGLSYQIQDDFLDLGEDERLEKTTYLSFFDENKGERKLDDLKSRSLACLLSLKDRDTFFLRELTESLNKRSS